MKKLITVGVMVLAARLALAVVTVPFYDGFNYTAASALAGNGGWVAASGSGTINVGSASLSFPGLTNGAGTDVSLTASGGNVRTDVNFTSQNTNSVYFSFLLKVNSRPSAQDLFGYASSSTSSDTTPPLGFFVKATGELGVGINTSTPQFTSAVLNVGQVYLVVVGYTFGTSDTATIWIDPASLGGTAPASTGNFSATHNSSLAYFLWNTPSSGGGSFDVDEFRIGSSYAAVTPSGSGGGGNQSPPSTAPRITRSFLSGGSFVLRGTNGSPGTGYEVICATNAALPVALWSVVASNNFDGSGNFDHTNAIPGGLVQRFYRLRCGGSTNAGIVTAPAITSQPQDQSAAVGQGALFSVTATGTAPLSYQWFFNTNSPIANATNATHAISNVSSNDAGGYSVRVSNSAGAVTSIVATLTISAAPTNGSFYVSATGNDANPGTLAAPFATLVKAASVAQPGQTIYLRGGTYFPSATIHITNSGTLGNRINLLAYPGEQPYFNFTNQPLNTANRGIIFTTSGNHWNVKGLEVGYAGDNGIKVEGSYLRFEQCVFHNNNDTGLQIGFGHTDSNPGGLLAAYVEVVNCDSYQNFDPPGNGGNADGFAAKMHCGQGIVFTGCRAWENGDDAWDLFETDYSVVISNCWCWKSAMLGGQGNGNGFKLGGNGSGGNSKGTHYAYNCVAFGCKVNGFTQNSHQDGEWVQHCLSFSNGTSGYNYYFEGSLNSGKQNVFKNNASLPRSGANTGGFIADNNPVEVNNSWNLAVTANTADYVSVLETAAKAPRKPDGSLPDGFARLVSGSDLIDKGVDVGLPFNGSAPDLGPYEFQP
ncbi:MAG: DUF1565 domain-containing protein [Verrucomicrobia bacterium]|nr:MAG: DUF1565 domain-containing protein [Verrucomicrobiota bacterium]